MKMKNPFRKEESPLLDKELALGETGYLYAKGGANLEIEKYNEDEVISKKGISYYKKIRRDEQVKSALLVKKFARLSTGWEIKEPDNASPDEKKATEFVAYCLGKVIFRKALKGIMTALDFGYSISEENWTIQEGGRYNGKIIFSSIKSKDPENYTFVIDEYDNILALRFQYTDALPINKFAVYSYNAEFENPYGNPDLNATYNSWWAKNTFFKFWAIYMERFGMPTTVGKYPRFSAAAVKTALQDALKGIQHKTSLSMSDECSIDLLESKTGGQKGGEWIAALDALDNRIARSILCPQLLGVSGSKFGSYALGKKQFDLFLWVLEELGSEIEDEVVNPQIVKRLVDYNYKVEKYPEFRFKPMTAENAERLFKVWADAVKSGVITKTEDDEKEMKKLIGLGE